MSWLRKILGQCVHKWVHHADLMHEDDARQAVGYILRCEKCGNLKTWKP